MSKYGELIQKARKPENQLASVLGESKGDSSSNEPIKAQEITATRPEEVNLSIKVPKHLRRHWVAEAKRRDTSLTAIIMASLKASLGEPTNDE